MFSKIFSSKKAPKIIFAQGNFDKKYIGTRHNISFEIIDKFADNFDGVWKKQAKFQAFVCEINQNGQKIILVKPTTFYNNTGISVQTIKNFYKIAPAQELLVIHDDLALPFGNIRTRQKGSDGGNNGIKSINSAIGDNYKRIRAGIYSDLRDKMDDADFVLSKFTKSEQNQIDEKISPKAIQIIHDFIDNKFEITSTNTLEK